MTGGHANVLLLISVWVNELQGLLQYSTVLIYDPELFVI
jgi:hypothetical protein